MRLAGALFVMSVLMVSSARADQMEDAAQIVCMPEAGYFSLDIRKVDDINIPAVNKGLRFERTALVWPAALVNPYACRLNGHVVRAAAVEWNAHKGDCLPKAGLSIVISYDGRTVACMDDNEELEDRRQSLTLTLNWGARSGPLLEHCAAPLNWVDANEQGTLHCEATILDAKTRGKKT